MIRGCWWSAIFAIVLGCDSASDEGMTAGAADPPAMVASPMGGAESPAPMAQTGGQTATIVGGRSSETQSVNSDVPEMDRDRELAPPSGPMMGGTPAMQSMAGMPMIALDGPECDPRARARACEPGWFCYPLPNGGGFRGRCQQGDGCTPGTNVGCSDERPYCHLKGGSTVCTVAGNIDIGQSCLNEDGVPQPCRDGLICNFSVCQVPCVPGEANDCPYEGRCVDLREATATPGGLCGPRNCNWFTGELCGDEQKCNYAIRSDGVLVGSCGPRVDAPKQNDETCEFLDGGGDNCDAGLACVAPPGGIGVCRILCDTGQYESQCPRGQRCKEILQTRQGVVRGYGLCTLNR